METLMNLLPFFGTAIGGQVVHILFKLSKLEKGKKFSLALWLQKNTFTTLSAFVSAVVGVWYLQDSLINGDPTLSHGFALTAAYVIDSALKNGKKSANRK